MNVFSKTGISLVFMVLLCMFADLTSASATPKPTAYDFDGDGKADMIWRNASNGNVSVWLMNGETIASKALLASMPSDWQIVGRGDVNGDGKGDVIWRNSTSGTVAVWLMNGLTITSTGFPGSAPTDWEIHAVGDLNGDGKADLLWRNTGNGAVAIWLMNGTTIASSGFPAGVPLEWEIAGAGDVNGDGKGDIIWRNSASGTVAVWLMNGLTITSTGFPGSASTEFEIAGIEDMDGNGKSDLVWRNTGNGVVAVWLMNGATIASSGFLTGVPTDWVIAQVSDVNGDGHADIIWRSNTSGVVSVWMMNGLAITSVGFPGSTNSSTSNDGSGQPALLTPTGSSTLPGATVPFTWTANGTALTTWGLRIGTSPGNSSLFNSGNLSSGTLARTVSGLPTNGGPIWVRLEWRHTDGTWSSTDVQFTAKGTASASPNPSGSGYYVSTTGNDANAGTQAAPFRTIKFALGQLVAGDRLFIRGGTYSEILENELGTNFPSGTSWTNPVTVAAFPGEQVTIVGNLSLGRETPLTQYVIFDGITIDATGRESGISLNGGTHHIRFINGEVKNAMGTSGIGTSYHKDANPGGTTAHEFINMHVHHNGNTKAFDHGFYLKTSGNLIERCNIHDNATWGILNYVGSTGPTSNNNTYRNNLIHHNGIRFGQGGGITLGSGNNNTAYNNVVWGNHTGIEVQPYWNPQHTQVFHNTVYANQGIGIFVSQTAVDTAIFNNISYLNQLNINDQGTRTQIGYNLTANPSFKNSSANDFHLQSGSAAIDTGTNISQVTTDQEGRKRPQGIRPDIGAYEW